MFLVRDCWFDKSSNPLGLKVTVMDNSLHFCCILKTLNVYETLEAAFFSSQLNNL